MMTIKVKYMKWIWNLQIVYKMRNGKFKALL